MPNRHAAPAAPILAVPLPDTPRPETPGRARRQADALTIQEQKT